MLCRESWVLPHVPQKLHFKWFCAVLTSSTERYSMNSSASCAVVTNRHAVPLCAAGIKWSIAIHVVIVLLNSWLQLKAGHEKASLSLALHKSIRWLRHAFLFLFFFFFDLPASYLMTWRSFITNFSLIRPQSLLRSSAHASLRKL